MNAAQRNELFARLQKSIPEPVTELKYRTRFQLLVSVILSAQATDLSVNRATRAIQATWQPGNLGQPRGIPGNQATGQSEACQAPPPENDLAPTGFFTKRVRTP